MKKIAVLLFFFFFASILGYPETQVPIKKKKDQTFKDTITTRTATPSPAAVSNNISKKDKPIPVYQKSTVFKKKSNNLLAGSSLGLEGYYEGSSQGGKKSTITSLMPAFFLRFHPSPSPYPRKKNSWEPSEPSPLTAVPPGAAAQALGIIPDDKTKEKK